MIKWANDRQIREELQDLIRPQYSNEDLDLESWNWDDKIVAENVENNVWELQINSQDRWRMRKWQRMDPDRSIWDIGNLEFYRIRRQVHSNQFKLDQYDFFTKECIRVLKWDPVEFWPKGRMHQNHAMAGVSDGNSAIIFGLKNLWVIKMSQTHRQFTINRDTIKIKYDQPSTRILEQMGIYNYE